MKRPELCDRCGEPLNDRGYSVSVNEKHPGAIDIHCGIDRNWELHLCGRMCLLSELNHIVNGLPPQQRVQVAA